ncbi:UNVERIFIED_CONTAM: hypothetical protein GTU68_031396 [Idotea baltica]|nr:hypothetical protein [Idotea baltica]
MPSFDVVSTVDEHEITNAVDQVTREIANRYDFKGSKSAIELKENLIEIVADDDMKLRAVQDVLKQKLSKRGISLKSVDFKKEEKAGGDLIKQEVEIKNGLTQDELKKLNKLVKAEKMKVSCQIQGDQLRVSGKKRDDLQTVIAFFKEKVTDLDLQFENFRD